MKVSLLAIGTELTTGQIVNKNGATMSHQLNSFGLEIVHHLVVPDDRAEILRALEYCSGSQMIFVTGGLGPTSDDFTREVIAEWTQQELIFDEGSWQHVIDRLTSRGFTVKDIQRQQCYFPNGSEVLKNSQGTAHGFMLTNSNYKHQPQIFVLPGPPREIEAIWHSYINEWLENKTAHIDKKITRSWDTMGVGESDVAQIVEKVFEGKKISSSNTQTETAALPFDIGYRVHLPYVEVKLTYPMSARFTCDLFVEKVDQALSTITMLKDFADVADLFAQKIAKRELAIYDFISDGFLLHRLGSALKAHPNWMYKQGTEPMDSDFFTEEQNFMALLPAPNDQVWLLANWNNKTLQKLLDSPIKSVLMNERRRQYFTEMALIEFVKNL